MGAQIAAHLANAGIRTFLLDIVPRGVPADAPASKRNAMALGAMKMMGKAKPAPFMNKAYAARITPGNLDDDLERAVALSDLVIEAVIERLDIKQSLFTRVAAAAKAGAILTSNTSGIAIASIAEGMPEDARKRLVGMHFFNPPRYMHLLEVVPSSFTDPEVTAELARFSDRVLGKGVVVCRDTPNFIGNRVGIAEMLLTFKATADGGYSIEEVDFLNGPLMGRPKTGSYRLGDMVGLDIVGHVVGNLREALSGDPESPNYDELYDLMVVPESLQKMYERKMLGDKTKGGFYKKTRNAEGKREILALDLETLEYRAKVKPRVADMKDIRKTWDIRERVAEALRAEGRGGAFLRSVYLPLFNYSANRLGEICETAREIDDAMCWGYGWQLGPFELWDAVGVKWGVEQLEKMGIKPAASALALLEQHGDKATWYSGSASEPKTYVPGEDAGYRDVPTPEGVIILKAVKDRTPVIHNTFTASLIDLGDGIACVEFHGPKINVIDAGVSEMLATVWDQLEKRGGFRGLVIGDQSDNFCAGANLYQVLDAAENGQWDELTAAIHQLQQSLMNLRHGPMPVVTAPHGLTLGGGAEIAMHGAAIEAHAELYMGLVEIGVGVLPAGGGLKEICRRASAWASQVPDGDPYPFVRRGFENAAAGKVATSADEARLNGWLAPGDRITFHKNRVIASAKARAISLAEAGWTPPDRDEPIHVIGAPRGSSFMLGAQLFEWGGYASAHDKLIGRKIAHVLSGGMTPTATTVTAQHLLDLEREAFVSLCGEEKTRARMQHMLTTNKPLRN